MQVGAATMDLLADLLQRRTGQGLQPARKWRADAALAAIATQYGLSGEAALVQRVTAGDEPLIEALVSALLNNETSFFRDVPAFAQLAARAIPALGEARAANRHLRIWSAGCSTGQEPYSLAQIFVGDPDRWAGWTIDIAATDVCPLALARARTGTYSQFEVQRGLSIHQMLRHFERDGESWRVEDAVRRPVRFLRHNLLDPAPGGPYDLVLCRNVLLYFTAEQRRLALDRIAQAMAPGGVLMLGAGETVLGHTDAFLIDPDLKGLYRLREKVEALRRVA